MSYPPKPLLPHYSPFPTPMAQLQTTHIHAFMREPWDSAIAHPFFVPEKEKRETKTMITIRIECSMARELGGSSMWFLIRARSCYPCSWITGKWYQHMEQGYQSPYSDGTHKPCKDKDLLAGYSSTCYCAQHLEG